jgi:quinohemoprotein ethanol dehydrogenase
VLATAGDLVFQGSVDGWLTAYDAHSGKAVWKTNLGLGITAPPISYAVSGRQYLSILVGFGGGFAGPAGEEPAKLGWAYKRHIRRLVTFGLDGMRQLPAMPSPQRAIPIRADFKVDPTLAAKGATVFDRCVMCHGAEVISGGVAPDLRASSAVISTPVFTQIVRGGALKSQRMPPFPAITDSELAQLQHYIRQQAEANSAGSWRSTVAPSTPESATTPATAELVGK